MTWQTATAGNWDFDMPTIAQGNNAVLVLTPSDSITITVPVGGSAIIESPTGTVVAGGFSGTRTFGPFSTGSATITAVTRDLYYEVGDGLGAVSRVRSRRNGSLVELLDEDGSTLGLSASMFTPASSVIVAKTNQQVTRSSANAGADNVKQALYSFLLPSGLMGPNGSLVWEAETSGTNSASGKNFGLRIGAVDICPEYNFTTNTNDHKRGAWHATSLSAQKYRGIFVQQGPSTTAFTTTAVDLSVDQTVEFYGRWSAGSVSGEALRLESLRVWVEYGA
jgi:hypothetical protein